MRTNAKKVSGIFAIACIVKLCDKNTVKNSACVNQAHYIQHIIWQHINIIFLSMANFDCFSHVVRIYDFAHKLFQIHGSEVKALQMSIKCPSH